ncbi:MAG TPA: septum formation family protein, partial [Acidimicrobiales bacterium]|nr:septum formation family protein [Acidimicrobiales bacterium]
PAWPQQAAWGPPPPPTWAPQEKRKRFGWGMVIGAFLIGGFISAIVTVIALVALAFAIGTPDAIAGTHPAIAEGARSVKAGDCLDDRPSLAVVVDQTDVVDCNEAHDAEVAAVIDVPGGESKPGEDDLQQYMDDACALAFGGYVGSDPDTSQYGYAAVVPSAEAWKSGDHTAFCLVDTVNTPGGSGSVAGSGD